MSSVRPKLARDIWDSLTVNGRYRRDVLNDFLVRGTHDEIDIALSWLVERGHVKQVGTTHGLIYALPERRMNYTNIRPVHGERALLQMHSNFAATEKPS